MHLQLDFHLPTNVQTEYLHKLGRDRRQKQTGLRAKKKQGKENSFLFPQSLVPRYIEARFTQKK